MGANRDAKYCKAFGLHLQEIRKQKKLSQEDLAYNCDLHLSQVGRLERGEANPTISTVKLLAEGLGVEPKKLLDFAF